MTSSANDWASPDPSKNITLAEADHFRDILVASLGLQFGYRFVLTQYGNRISETELRQNNFLSVLPVNLMGLLVPGSQEFNVAQLRQSIRDAASSDDPIGYLNSLLQQIFPHVISVSTLYTQIPAVRNLIASALKNI